MSRLAPCQDREVLAHVHARLLALRCAVGGLQSRCQSAHACTELDILRDVLTTHAESLELCAMECSDAERDESENAQWNAVHAAQDEARGRL